MNGDPVTEALSDGAPEALAPSPMTSTHRSYLLAIDQGNSAKDSFTLSLFFLVFFIFLGSNNIFRSEGHRQETTVDFDDHCQPRLKHASFSLTKLDADVCPIRILMRLRMFNGLIRGPNNISFDAAITHTYKNHSYVMHRLHFPYTRVPTSKPGITTDDIQLFLY
jgi:hypothetical protein